MKPISKEKKTNMKYGAAIGAVAGLAIFVAFYTMNPTVAYLFFIPFGALMGYASQYVKDDEEEED
jgi:hypothetical protein